MRPSNNQKGIDMRNKRAMAALWFVAVAACASATAMAADTGFYMGASVGRSQIHSDDSQITLGPDLPYTKNSGDLGYKLFAGYQAFKYLGIEAEALNLGKQSVKFQTIDRTNDMTMLGFNLSLVGSYDFGNLQVFAKAGASMLANRSHEYGADFVRMEGTPDADNTDWSVRPSFGLGAAYNFTRHFAIRTEWQHFKAAAGEHTVDMTSNLFTVGAQYKF
ncbi:outer membrane beta-barrel protein [Paraburkholderia phenazinium]|nr:outer membrane beta-barrel protein [Paraburkholderia phenazinium]